MSSSISSSDTTTTTRAVSLIGWRDRSTGARVALVVIAVILALELFTRFKLFRMSKDFRRFSGYGGQAAALVGASDAEGDGMSIAFIGNSATMHGVDTDLVAREMSERCGVPVRAEMFTADASRVNTWHFILESTFWKPGNRPDAFVVTFYEDDLADGNRIEIGRVAQFFTDVHDWPDVFDVDLQEFPDRAEFVVSSGWATYAARARIRERVLGLVPGYEDYLTASNAVIYRHERAAAAAAASDVPRERTYRALERVLRRAGEEESALTFIAYPTLETAEGRPYPLDTGAVDRLTRAGAGFIDLRGLRDAGIGPSLYMDDIHLSPAGRDRYSRHLAALLSCDR